MQNCDVVDALERFVNEVVKLYLLLAAVLAVFAVWQLAGPLAAAGACAAAAVMCWPGK